MNNIGDRVRTVRKNKKMTLTTLAQETGLSVAYLSNLERNLCSPTLEYIQKVCTALDISLVKLLDDKNWTGNIILQDELEVIFEIPGKIQYRSANFGEKKMEGLVITVESGYEYEKEWVHTYDEIGYVISGSIKVMIEQKEYIANTGDVFYIEAFTRHCISNPFEDSSITYWVKQPESNRV